MFSNIVVLYEIYSKKLQWPITFGTSLYLYVVLNTLHFTFYNVHIINRWIELQPFYYLMNKILYF